MASFLRLAAITILASITLTPGVAGQTYSHCNPTVQSCQPDPALGKGISVDFDSAPSDFTAQGAPTYSSNGAAFTVAKSGDSPTLVSKWYIMFGEVSVTMKAAPGTGIVSSVVLQSDDLDEIDWEWLGGSGNSVQSNYFGKGQTTTYDRAAVHAVSNTQGQWHTYTTRWTADQVVWSIDGSTVRVLNAGAANGQYPQTPMQLKIGAWSGGDPSNSPGTIQWAGGSTNYAGGPYTMYVRNATVIDYSTGQSYSYGDRSGSWNSIVATGGKVNGNSGGTATVTAAPAITSTTSGQDAWDGTHKTDAATVSYTSLPGLPSGWTVTGSGKVVPSSATAIPSPSLPSSPSPVASPLAACSVSGFKTITSYDQRGFITTATIPAGASTGWNEQGFPTTIYPANCMASNTPATAGEPVIKEVSNTTPATLGSQSLLATAEPSSLITAQVSQISGAQSLPPGTAAFLTAPVAFLIGALLL